MHRTSGLALARCSGKSHLLNRSFLGIPTAQALRYCLAGSEERTYVT
jgi:hypothetical protein